MKNQPKLINGEPNIKHSMENQSTQTQTQMVTFAKYAVAAALDDHFKD